tara:strand:+ start:700 stop:1929 length:1230 start_codon:yes stop_codon:yes gene_type:complete
MATDFKYASQSDLGMYYPNFSSYDAKKQIHSWEQLFTHGGFELYEAHNAGFVDILFQDGEDLTPYKKTENYTDSTANTDEAVDIIETAIDVTDGSVFGYGDVIKIDDEKMLITNISSNTITVRRGFLGTTTATHNTGVDVYIGVEWSEEKQWLYNSGCDSVLLYEQTSNPNDLLMESGYDNATFFDQMLVNASMELNNLLDGRYATPLPKVAQIDQNTASNSQSKEYDAIVVKMTCYLCVANILRAEGQTEEADYYYAQVTNGDRTGMVDRLNAGEFKLSYEVDAKDRLGKVNAISVSGSMDIVETGGQYVGEAYDLLKITCTTTGAYGVAKVKVEYYGNDKIFGQETDPELVTGGLQALDGLGGLMVRFQGASMTQNDYWEIEVASASREITNAQSNAIDLTRRGYSY